MKLKSFNYIIGLVIILFYTPLQSEEKKIDIWDNSKEKKLETPKKLDNESSLKSNIKPLQTIEAVEKIKIQEDFEIDPNEQKVFGIYEPANYDLNLNMWSTTKAEDLRSSLKRINKIDLSRSSVEILEAILFSFSYPPQGMNEKNS